MQPVKYWGESTFRDMFTTVIGESNNASDLIDNDIIKIYVHTSSNYDINQPFPINGFDENVELFVCGLPKPRFLCYLLMREPVPALAVLNVMLVLSQKNIVMQLPSKFLFGDKKTQREKHTITLSIIWHQRTLDGLMTIKHADTWSMVYHILSDEDISFFLICVPCSQFSFLASLVSRTKRSRFQSGSLQSRLRNRRKPWTAMCSWILCEGCER
jgi:hypothetical protein